MELLNIIPLKFINEVERTLKMRSYVNEVIILFYYVHLFKYGTEFSEYY